VSLSQALALSRGRGKHSRAEAFTLQPRLGGSTDAIGVLGTGAVGQTLATEPVELGHEVTMGEHEAVALREHPVR
jgi:hypothetical protein